MSGNTEKENLNGHQAPEVTSAPVAPNEGYASADLRELARNLSDRAASLHALIEIIVWPASLSLKWETEGCKHHNNLGSALELLPDIAQKLAADAYDLYVKTCGEAE